MTELEILLAEMENQRVQLQASDLSSSQTKAIKRAISRKVRPRHEIKKLEIDAYADSRYVYVYCVAGLPGDEGTAAEIFCRSGFHACIGPRGGIKYL